VLFFRQLPVSVYESVIDVEAGNAVPRLAPISYTLATEEAERIGVDHVARVSNVAAGTESSSGMGYRK